MDISQMLQQGSGNALVFVPTAILLGALHGLEPGHSKTMMAAFIIAVRGTIFQAVLLGLSAAISHSLIIWILAAGALRFGSSWSAESTEPYFQIGSGVMIAGLAAWMFWRTRREQRMAADHADEHEKEGPHHGQLVDTGHGFVEVEVFETGVLPRFRLHFFDSGKKPKPAPTHDVLQIETRRDGGENQTFEFKRVENADGGSFLESLSEIPEPHAFTAILTQSHHDHAHRYEIVFTEDAHHHHHHADLSDLTQGEYADAHERAHATDIARRFSNRSVTTGQIIWFGVTGGLMPCPAAFTVLLVCLQLKRFTLGFALVAAFSLGLALTMVASGVFAAWGVRHAEKRFKGFGKFAQRAPYVSAVLLGCLATFFIIQGWRHLA
jgi:nickel/cobalt transporter (NicO) family protein